MKKEFQNYRLPNLDLFTISEENRKVRISNYYAKEGRFDDAINLFRSRLQYYPTDYQGHRYIVNLLTKQKKYQKALDECQLI